MTDTEPCAKCGRETPLHLLDAKPGPGHWSADRLWRAAQRGADFNRLECGDCYGPGYVALEPDEALHRAKALRGEL